MTAYNYGVRRERVSGGEGNLHAYVHSSWIRNHGIFFLLFFLWMPWHIQRRNLFSSSFLFFWIFIFPCCF